MNAAALIAAAFLLATMKWMASHHPSHESAEHEVSTGGMLITHVIERWLAPCFLLVCLVLGGASGAGAIANAVAQITALVVFLLLIWSGAIRHPAPAARGLLAAGSLAAGLLLLQLVPLPPAIWGLLPGRSSIMSGYQMTGMSPPWLPLSLAPDGTIAALLSLLPPSAMFIATVASGPAGRRSSVYMLVGFAAASVLLGMLQELNAAGYIYTFSSFGGAVGLFANRNHLATLCLMAMPFAAALSIAGIRLDLDGMIGRKLIAGSLIGFLAVGVVIVESIAGWVFLAPTLVACFLVYQRERGALQRRTVWLTGAAVTVGLIMAVAASLSVSDLSTQANGINPRERRESIRLTSEAAVDFLPFGSGFGSFRDLYPRYENPANVSSTYVNHAHSDYVELLLEAGVPGIALIGCFLAWWILRSRGVWQRRSPAGACSRAACISIAVPLAHSLVDYPFRTAAIAASTAFACGLLVAQDSERSSRAGASRFPGRPREDSRTIVLSSHAPERDAPQAISGNAIPGR